MTRAKHPMITAKIKKGIGNDGKKVVRITGSPYHKPVTYPRYL